MISNAAIAGLAFSLVVSAAAPFVVYAVLRRRMTLSWRNIGIGAAMFVVSAMVLEQILHYVVLKAVPVTSAWFTAHRWGFAIYGLLAAGLFEETGRYIGLRYLARPTGNPGTAVAYGLGHGGMEMLLIGALGEVSAILLALLDRAGALAAVLGGRLPAAAVDKIHAQFGHLTFWVASLGGIERLLALTAQIAFTFVVWRAVETRRIRLLFAAMALHVFVDSGAALLQAGYIKSVWIAEGWILVAVAVTVLIARRLTRPA